MASSSDKLKKIYFVGGKGGVGKTTISCTMGLYLSKTHKTALISTDPAHSLADSMGVEIDSEFEKKEDKQLLIWELNAQKAYEKFQNTHYDEFKMILDTSTYLDETDINQFLGLAVPGIDEIMGFKSIIDLVNTDEYEYFVIDTAPTGHALRLLFIPELLDQWIKQIAALRWKYREVQKAFVGKYTPDEGDDMLLTLKKAVLRMRAILRDSNKAEFVIVGKPEKMVFEESIDLKYELESHEIKVNHLILNNVMGIHEGCDFCEEVRKHQTPIIEEYKKAFAKQHIIEIEQKPSPVSGKKALESLFPHLTPHLN